MENTQHAFKEIPYQEKELQLALHLMYIVNSFKYSLSLEGVSFFPDGAIAPNHRLNKRMDDTLTLTPTV